MSSKNLYDVLGNDIEEDASSVNEERRIVDKKSTGTKRTGPAETSASSRPSGGNDVARDRKANIGRESNLNRPLGEDKEASRGGRGARGRGGRGAGHARPNDDRHSRRVPGSEKQAAQSWGATEGQAELNDEEAGEKIAQDEQKEALADGEGIKTDGDGLVVDESAEPAEPEVKQLSLEEYLAQRAEKKADLGTPQEIRKANEGAKQDKKWAAKALEKTDVEEFISGSGTKTKRERGERKTKETIELNNAYQEPAPTRGGSRGFGGGRGGGRGDRGDRGDRDNFRGGDRGDRNFGGERSERGDRGRGRGGPRGGRGPREGPRDGGNRGYQGQRNRDDQAAINTADESAFPSLGA